MDDRDQTDRLCIDMIDDPVRTDDQLSNIGSLEFWHDPAQFRERLKPVNRLENSLNSSRSVMFRVPRDVAMNRLEVRASFFGPPDHGHRPNRRLISS